MKVIFRSKHPYLQVTHEELFHVGVVVTSYGVDGEWLGSQAEWETLQKLPDPERVNRSYCFCEGEEHNQLTLEREDAIEGMRAYIAQRDDYLIVELNAQGNVPADPEGVVFECRTPLTKLYPAMYKGCTPAEGKTFVFNRGENQNRYITSDSEEIKILREFINQRVDAEFTEVNE